MTLKEIGDYLHNLNEEQLHALHFELLGWMSNKNSDSREYLKAMTNLLSGSEFKVGK